MLRGHQGPCLAVRFNAVGTYCMSGGKVIHSNARCPAPVACSCCLQLLPAANTAGPPRVLQDRTVRLWNPHRGIQIKVYSGHGYEVRDVAIASDNSK